MEHHSHIRVQKVTDLNLGAVIFNILFGPREYLYVARGRLPTNYSAYRLERKQAFLQARSTEMELDHFVFSFLRDCISTI